MDELIKAIIENTTHTIEGYPVRNLKWNSMDNIFVGQVKDPILGNKDRLDGYIVCQWRRNGFATNKYKGREDLKLNIVL